MTFDWTKILLWDSKRPLTSECVKMRLSLLEFKCALGHNDWKDVDAKTTEKIREVLIGYIIESFFFFFLIENDLRNSAGKRNIWFHSVSSGYVIPRSSESFFLFGITFINYFCHFLNCEKMLIWYFYNMILCLLIFRS